MCASVKKIISGKKIRKCKIINFNVIFPESEYILVTGKVLSPYKNPLANAAITIFSIDKRYCPAKKKYVGITFSDEHGIYGVSIPRNLGISYEFKAYSSINI
ncbi:carboxypeptidase regulatory-like domain-containing protein [Clostridium weizhouense]|uniref:Carboxypeptidase regulatory-like domain-containing protein n=1 Tax=Clostridium weizhouense TaxID=2859781 RepID=A0ABS7ALD5_9CLOT|nr:carboxypeptidase regulatory-like domain-containing protein [Clostridium weizhouense]MBW6409472.1 carboxypeptidase regulatory-like domain-containing protein [Clostridium weizhouense]